MHKKKFSKVLRVISLFILVILVFAHCNSKSEKAGDKQAAEDSGNYEVFEKYREYAKSGKTWPEKPGKGKKLGFANIYGTIPFCISVEQDIIKQAKFAGFSKKDLIIMDNQYDAVIALKNADIMLSKRPDIFVEFQADAKVNNIVAKKFHKANIPLIAVEVAVPGAPFIGINNCDVSLKGGKYMAKLIKEQWGGWDKVDLVVLLQNPSGGEVTMLRSEGFADGLVEIFGKKAEKKIKRTDGGMGQTEQAKAAMDDVLAAYPDAKKICAASLNEQTMAGIIASLQNAGRWNADDVIIITLGGDDLGQMQLREGLSDAFIAFFPEKYGEFIVPAVCAILDGHSVPPNIYVETKIVTIKDINKYYKK